LCAVPWSLPCLVYLRGLSDLLSEWAGLDEFFVLQMQRLALD
jgi:hypothetical protein